MQIWAEMTSQAKFHYLHSHFRERIQLLSESGHAIMHPRECTSQTSNDKEHNWPGAQLLCAEMHSCVLPAAATPPQGLLPECSRYKVRSLMADFA